MLKTVALLVIWMCLLLLFPSSSVVTPVFRIGPGADPSQSRALDQSAALLRDVWSVVLALRGVFPDLSSGAVEAVQAFGGAERESGGVVGWVLCSLLFANVMPNMWRTNAVYEALGSVVIILIWAQACAWSVIIGACWIVRFPERRRGKKG